MDEIEVKPAPRSRWRLWLVGVLLVSALILVVSHLGELEHFSELLRQAEPRWLLMAVALQLATYVSVAFVWYLPLRAASHGLPFWSLVPLGVAKLFADKSMPSGGMSGTAFFIAALSRRGISDALCVSTLLLSLVAYYGAYLLLAAVALLLLYFAHALQPWIVGVALVFSVVAVGIPASALWLRSRGGKAMPPFLQRVPGVGKFIQTVASSPADVPPGPVLLVGLVCCHGLIFLLDSATLWVMMQVVGVPISYWAALPSFVFASMVATVGPIPLGVGTFEVTCVSMLGAMGVPIEAALSATLLLRGFTLWIPMLPGMWLARRALR